MITRESLEHIVGESITEMGCGSGKIVTESGKVYFLKAGAPSPIYRCEANGLQELAKSNQVHTANVIAAGEDFILTEYIQRHIPNDDFRANFGRQFARMHRHTAEVYGFYEDNFIGENPQLNIAEGKERSDWTTFFFNKRLLVQYRLAEKQGLISERLHRGFLKLETEIESLLEGSEEKPTLLHGDLWSGNYLFNHDGEAVLIDPAVYYGHREADLAMTRLFGGLSPAFYKGYQEEYPLKEGWEQRERVYKLYHLLNHLNLFGRAYLAETESLL